MIPTFGFAYSAALCPGFHFEKHPPHTLRPIRFFFQRFILYLDVQAETWRLQWTARDILLSLYRGWLQDRRKAFVYRLSGTLRGSLSGPLIDMRGSSPLYIIRVNIRVAKRGSNSGLCWNAGL